MRDGSRMGVLERVDEKPKAVEAPVIQEEQKPVIPVTPRVPRPSVLMGVTYKADSPIGKIYMTINENEKHDPFEVFINHGKSGSDLMAMADALGRMISFVLRIHSPVPARERMREIVSELSGIGGSRSIGFGENRVRSLPDAVSKVLAKHFQFRVNGKVEDKQTIQALQSTPMGTAADVANGEVKTMELPAKDEVTLNQLSLPETGVAAVAASSSTGLFDLCPECGSGTLAYEEGCKKCYACGYSEC
jgi:ribonucleoside-diphosphate reductase alpha chain